jgi:pyruvate dehydrogenase kinase 2/3/4
VERDVRPISLRQLTFFGRTLTESRLISSANYVRTELPTRYRCSLGCLATCKLFSLTTAKKTNRIAHRLRDMQRLPYVVVANPHISYVYELYYRAFERLRVVSEICTLGDNDKYCEILRETLEEYLTVMPNLAMGVLECNGLVQPDEMDRFMNTMMRAVRIARSR